jgi:PAS domain S-box-containing protein
MVGEGRKLRGKGGVPRTGSTCAGLAGYAVAALSVVALTVGLAELNPYFPMGRFPIVIALPVAISAYLYGRGPALLAYVLALASYIYFFVAPENAIWPPKDAIDAWASITAFMIGGSILLAGALRVRKDRDNVELLAHDLYESNERTNTILESITDSYFSLDNEWRFIEINPIAEQTIFHRPESELVGRVYWEAFPEVVGSELLHHYQQAVAEGRPVHFEGKSRHAEHKWFEAHAYPREDRLEVYLRDITQRRLAEHELRELAQRLDSHMQNSPLAVIEWDADYRVVRWSEEAEHVFGWTAAEMQGKRIDELRWVYEEDWGKVAKLMEDMNAGIRPRSVNPNRNYCKDGSVIWCEWYNSVLKDDSGSLISVLSLVLDVTDRETAIQDSGRAREEAETRAAELETLIESMADGVMLIGIDGEPVLGNEAARLILGGPPGTPVQEWLRAFALRTIDGEPLPIEQWGGHRALQGETISATRYGFATHWTEGVVSLSGSPVRDPEGRIIGGVLVFRDIGDEVEFEQRKEALYHREHHIAEMLQQALVPSGIPSRVHGCRIAARYQSALAEAEVGGDFYDVFDVEDGRVGVLIGDVAGKGLLAAMRVAAGRYSVRSYALLDPSPARVMTLANDALSRDESPGFTSMVTAFLAVIDTRSGVVTYANGGHEPPLIRRANGEIEELNVGGRALGVMGGFNYQEAATRLQPGDTLVLVTDGITEARRNGVLWGKDGMIGFLSHPSRSSPEEIADGLLEAAKAHTGGGLHDDAAIVVVQVGDFPLAD